MVVKELGKNSFIILIICFNCFVGIVIVVVYNDDYFFLRYGYFEFLFYIFINIWIIV